MRFRRIILLLIPALFLFNSGIYAQKKEKKQKIQVSKPEPAKVEENRKPKITFVELGSVSCIPCKQMQPIMKSIEKKYGEQIKVVFHDVWKDEAPAKLYGIRVIPTQVFLDENGKEFFRHEGYYPEKEIDKLFQSKGLIVKSER